MKKYPESLLNLEELRKNTRLNKHQHFSAAERAHKSNILCGVPVVVTNVFLGSLLFVSLSEAVPVTTVWIGGFLALGAAFCSALQTFFNFDKLFEGHRRIANRYLQLQRDCEIAKSEYLDGVSNKNGLTYEYRKILNEYNGVNCDAESYHTGKCDYRLAIEYDKKKCKEEDNKVMRQRLENSMRKLSYMRGKSKK